MKTAAAELAAVCLGEEAAALVAAAEPAAVVLAALLPPEAAPPPLAATQEQRAWAEDWTIRAVSTEQAAMTGEVAAAWMAAELEHWQAKSVRPQP